MGAKRDAAIAMLIADRLLAETMDARAVDDARVVRYPVYIRREHPVFLDLHTDTDTWEVVREGVIG